MLCFLAALAIGFFTFRFSLFTFHLIYSSFFTLISRLERMASTPPVVMPDDMMLRSSSGMPLRMSGINSTLRPPAKLMAITRISLRPSCCEAMMRMPVAATVPNMRSVAPPSTGCGMRPITFSQAPHRH